MHDAVTLMQESSKSRVCEDGHDRILKQNVNSSQTHYAGIRMAFSFGQSFQKILKSFEIGGNDLRTKPL